MNGPGCTTFVLPEGMRLGGVTSWSARMCRQLSERGRMAALIQHAPDGAPLAIPLPDAVLNMRCANQKPPIDGSLNMRDLEQFAADYGRALPGTVVPNWSPGTYATCALLSQRNAERLRVLGFAHTDEPEYYDWLSYYEPIIHRFVAVSAEIAHKLKERIPYRAEHIVIRPYAVEVPDISRRVGYSHAERPLRLAYAGRLSERQKRVSDLAHLAELLEEAGVNFQLDVVGSGVDERTLRDRVRALSESVRRRVTLRGLFPIDAMTEFWLSVDVSLLVSDYEGTSITMLEAMACGCVPLVTRVSGTAAVIRSGANGFTVPVGDLARMVAVLKDLAGDRQRLAAVGMEARKTAETWSHGRYLEWFLGLLNEVWAENPRSWSTDRPLLPPAATGAAAHDPTQRAKARWDRAYQLMWRTWRACSWR